MSRHDQIVNLRHDAPVVLPSLLLCDFGNLEREVRQLEDAGVKALHLDVMDGHFVPNLSYGMPLVAAFRRLTELPLDVHLMISRPERYIDPFLEAGADLLTIHVEAEGDSRANLERIRDGGGLAGLALNPDTPLDRVEPLSDACDLVLVMSVEAGFGGQAFNEVAVEKLGKLRSLVGPDVILEVDGGINGDTIRRCAEAGAQWFVVGSGIFRTQDYARAVAELERRASVT